MSNDLSVKEDSNSLLSQNNFEHYYRIANMMSKSEMVPKGYKDKPQDILLAMEYGRSLNLGPLQAVQNIAVINGKPSIYGDGILAVCSGHPEFENIEEQPIIEAGKTIGYKCTVKRKGRSDVTQSFTIEQATAAGLWGRQGPWKQYPDRMLQMRARSFALRDSFADALGGVRVAEEVQDYEIKDVTPQSNKSEDAKAKLSDVISKNKEAESKNSQENKAYESAKSGADSQAESKNNQESKDNNKKD